MTTNQVIDEAISLFYKYTNNDRIPFEIEITNDVYQRRLELAIDEEDYNDVLQCKDNIIHYNGTIALPKLIHEKSYILIAEKACNDDLQHIGTIIHELTHIHDFFDLLNFNNYKQIKMLKSIPSFDLYTLWSEYHAKRIGYCIYRAVLRKLFIYEDDGLNDIINIELPFQNEQLHLSLAECKGNPFLYMRSLFYYFGRYSVWRDLFPTDFSNLPEEFITTYGNSIKLLYNYLCINNKSNLIIGKLDELRLLMDNLFDE